MSDEAQKLTGGYFSALDLNGISKSPIGRIKSRGSFFAYPILGSPGNSLNCILAYT